MGCELVGKLLQAVRLGALDEGVGALTEVDALLAHPVGQPVMLIEVDAGREWQVGADAYEHAAPSPVVDVEIVLNHPAPSELQMPAVDRLIADGDHDAGGFTCLQDDDRLIRLGAPEVRFNELISASLWRLQHRHFVFLRPRLQPLLKAIGDPTQHLPADRVELAVGVEKADHSSRLLERLDQSVQQDPVKATIVETNAVLVMLVKRIHESPRRFAVSSVGSPHLDDNGISRAEPLAS